MIKFEYKRPAVDGTSGDDFVIECDPAKDFIPMASTHTMSNGAVEKIIIQKMARISWSGGHIYFPISISCKNYSPSGEFLMGEVDTVDEKSIAIGKDIPDQQFTIPRSRAKSVFDADTKKYVSEPRIEYL